jgi:hypothetical protein
MAILDRLLTFTGNVATGTIVDSSFAASGDASNIIDLGLNYPGVPANTATTALGGARDIGVGDDPMLKLLIQVVTPFTTSANTLTCSLSGAPGTAGDFATPPTPGAFTTMWTSPAVAASSLLVPGVYLANVDVPRQIPGQPMPRFLKVTFTVSGALPGGGSVYAGIVIDRWDQPWGGTAAAPFPSGYVPGVVVAN